MWISQFSVQLFQIRRYVHVLLTCLADPSFVIPWPVLPVADLYYPLTLLSIQAWRTKTSPMKNTSTVSKYGKKTRCQPLKIFLFGIIWMWYMKRWRDAWLKGEPAGRLWRHETCYGSCRLVVICSDLPERPQHWNILPTRVGRVEPDNKPIFSYWIHKVNIF